MKLLVLFGMMAVLNGATSGTVERIRVHGKALEGNLSGDSAYRDVAVYLPPSYQTAKNKRYPVVYLLHGFTDNVEQWWGTTKPHFINVPKVADGAFAAGAKEMIIVMPDAFTKYQGSMYSSSVTIGDWETFIARDLVSYVDSHYRTLANRGGRGLAGHSMGGYGTIRIGMKRPEVFSSLYLLSPCCLSPMPGRPNPKAEAIQDAAEIAKADFMTKAAFASAAAWSPNPKNPPFYLDLPVKDGNPRPEVLAKWQANAPLVMVDQYVSSLKQYNGICMDAGDKEAEIGAATLQLHNVLAGYGIEHLYETYPGDHVSGVAMRIEKVVLPFFAARLK